MALQRVLAGYAKHPNVAAYIVIGLGCEVNQAAVMIDRQKMSLPGHAERKPFLVNIQEAGGIRKTVERAAVEVAKLLPIANEAQRTKQPVSELDAGHQLRRLRRQLAASPPTPRSAGRWTSWCATAAPACWPRRPRSTAPSTC